MVNFSKYTRTSQTNFGRFWWLVYEKLQSRWCILAPSLLLLVVRLPRDV